VIFAVESLDWLLGLISVGPWPCEFPL